jgi:hypothetical protein
MRVLTGIILSYLKLSYADELTLDFWWETIVKVHSFRTNTFLVHSKARN